MNHATTIVGPDDKEAKIKQFNSKKIVLGTIREDQFLYISFEYDYKHYSCCYHLFLSPLLKVFFLFNTLFLFYLHPPRVDQIIGIDPRPISSFLESLGEIIRLKITIQVSLPHYCGESQLQSIQCGGSNFLLDISQFPFVLYLHDVYHYQQNLLEHCPRWQTIPLDLCFAQPRR